MDKADASSPGLCYLTRQPNTLRTMSPSSLLAGATYAHGSGETHFYQ
jgi:hypothetical protein